jgi:hypothetical protein
LSQNRSIFALLVAPAVTGTVLEFALLRREAGNLGILAFWTRISRTA